MISDATLHNIAKARRILETTAQRFMLPDPILESEKPGDIVLNVLYGYSSVSYFGVSPKEIKSRDAIANIIRSLR